MNNKTKAIVATTAIVLVAATTFFTATETGRMVAVDAVTAGNTYYVSPTGTDNTACSLLSPCLTFSKAVELMTSGDTLQFLAGTYNNQTLVINKSGNVDRPLTFSGGSSAVLDLKRNQANGINVYAASQYIVISGFELTGAVSHTIFVRGNNVLVENNIIHDSVTENKIYPTCGKVEGWGSALKAEQGSHDLIFRDNKVQNNCGEGIGVTMANAVLVENNEVWNNFQVNIYIDNSFNVVARGNHSYCDNGKKPAGIALGLEYYNGWGNQLHDISVENNLIENCSAIQLFQDFGYSLASNANIKVINNNFIGVSSPFVDMPSWVVQTGNVAGTPPAVTGSAIPSATNTNVPLTPTPRTPTAPQTRTATPTATRTATPVPTVCEFSAHYMICTR